MPARAALSEWPVRKGSVGVRVRSAVEAGAILRACVRSDAPRTRTMKFDSDPNSGLLTIPQHDRVAEQSHLVRDAERLPDLRAMELDRPRAHAQHLRDLRAAFALTDEVED